jgi:Na+-transporting methylmalonyl-CoA/oxaloacetate decarboxylase gamma subunit
MNASFGGLLLEGLRVTVIGLAWVFVGLALVWGLVGLLNRFFPGTNEDPSSATSARIEQSDPIPGAIDGGDPLTAERAQVAAIVAAAILAGALPIRAEAPVGPGFEHGRTAPNWVTGNRARALRPWQPPRQRVD